MKKEKKEENQQIENDVNPYISNQCKSYILLQFVAKAIDQKFIMPILCISQTL